MERPQTLILELPQTDTQGVGSSDSHGITASSYLYLRYLFRRHPVGTALRCTLQINDLFKNNFCNPCLSLSVGKLSEKKLPKEPVWEDPGWPQSSSLPGTTRGRTLPELGVRYGTPLSLLPSWSIRKIILSQKKNLLGYVWFKSTNLQLSP